MRRVVYRTAAGEVITFVHPLVDLLAAGQAARVRIATECVGNGACGRCKVRVVGAAPAATDGDRRHVTAAELGAGWRLACQLRPPASGPLTALVVEVPVPTESGLALEVPVELRAPPGALPARLVIDAGTEAAAYVLTASGGISGLAVGPLEAAAGMAALALAAAGGSGTGGGAAPPARTLAGAERIDLVVEAALASRAGGPPALLVLLPGDPTRVILLDGPDRREATAPTPALSGRFEGGALSLPGAVDLVTLDGPDGRTVVHTIAEEPASGLSGPGLLSLAASPAAPWALASAPPGGLVLVRGARTASRDPLRVPLSALAAWRASCAALALAIEQTGALALPAVEVVVCPPAAARMDPDEVRASGLLPSALAAAPLRVLDHATLRGLLGHRPT